MKHVTAAIGALGVVVVGCGSSAPTALPIGIQSDASFTFTGGPDASTSGLSVAITPAAPSVCPGECVTLAATASGGRAPYAFAWSPEAASDGGNITVCPSQTTTYGVNATDSSGSGGELQRANLSGSANVTVTVDASCGGDDSGNVTFATGDAAGAQGIDAYIEQGQVAVRLITLSCAGDCATVQAVGTGGYPPYTYAWENGSTNPVRQVCPASDTAYSVKVTDTGGSGENLRPPQTAGASVTADVLACPDGGPGDAAAVLSTDGCVGGFVNPSIDGTPQTAVGGAWDASGWTQCPCLCPTMGDPSYLANQSTSALGQYYPAPSAGQTYAVIPIKPGFTTTGFGQQFCAPAAAGTSFRIDAMLLDPSPPGTTFALAVYGGEAVCNESGTMVWAAASLTQSWTTYCVTLAQATPAITFNGAYNNPAATALILIDNIVPVSSCP
jgi:hypothetical protein